MESQKKTALLSAYDKKDLEFFAGELQSLGWNILASSGTARYLAEKGIKVRDVSEIVGPPILGHRVVTLSREIHAALLSTESPEDVAELARLGIPRIDLVYVNLYPLQDEIARPGSTFESVIEKTDIGGPTLLRSAIKGGRIAACRTRDLKAVEKYLRGNLHDDPIIRQKFISSLACIAERVIADYCSASSEHYRKIAGGMPMSFLEKQLCNVFA